MRQARFGIYALIFAGLVVLMAILHYFNVIPMLNTVLPAVVSLVGGLLGLMGYFERDKRRTPALLGMAVNFLLLAIWVAMVIRSFTN